MVCTLLIFAAGFVAAYLWMNRQPPQPPRAA
jgi:hypothetical protein